MNVTEGGILQVCLELTDIPAGGLSCDITVTLAAQPYVAGKQGMKVD